MMIGLLMLIAPIAVFLLSIPFSRRFTSGLRQFYLIFGAIVVLIGSGTSIYFATMTGDQGGIAAYFLQLAVIVVYAILLTVVLSIYLVMKYKTR